MSKENKTNSMYNQMAIARSKLSIFCWIVSGIIYQLLTKNFVSWQTLLLLFPGIFIASFIAIPLFLLDFKLTKKLEELNDTNMANSFLKGAKTMKGEKSIMLRLTILKAAEGLLPILLAIYYLRVLNTF